MIQNKLGEIFRKHPENIMEIRKLYEKWFEHYSKEYGEARATELTLNEIENVLAHKGDI